MAAKSGGGDPGTNARLRVAIDKAKAESLPKEIIDKTADKYRECYSRITGKEV